MTEKEKRFGLSGETMIRFMLALLILLQMGYTTYVFAFRKQGFYSDEIFSYGLANSYYQPYMGIPGDAEDLGHAQFVMGEDGNLRMDLEKSGLVDSYQWVPGSRFQEYLSVQPGQRFAYGSVIYNQSLDMHPPLYYLLLHTVCSLFPDSFSVWYAYVLNMLFLIGVQIFLFLTAREISRSSVAALLSCVLYGGSAGALNTFMFLRQYSLQTMLCLMFTFFAVRVYHKRKAVFSDYKFDFLGAVLSAFAAFMTQYYSIIYVGAFTLFYCAILLLEKRWKKMFLFGCSMLAVLGVFIALWPYMFGQYGALEESYEVGIPFAMQMKVLLRQLCRNCFGFSFSMLATPFWSIVLPPLLFMVIFIPALLLPFRDEVWCQKIFAKAKAFPGKVKRFMQKADFSTLILVLSMAVYYTVTGGSILSVGMGNYVIRYIMISLPILCMVAVIWAFWILSRMIHAKRICCGVLAFIVTFMALRTHMLTEPVFVVPHFGESQDTTQLLEDCNVVVIYDSYVAAFRFLNWVTPYLTKTRNSFVVSADLADSYRSDIAELGEPVDYVLVKASLFEPDEEQSETAEKILEEFDAYSIESNFLSQMMDESKTYSSEEGFKDVEELNEAIPRAEKMVSQVGKVNTGDGEEELFDCAALIQSLNGGCDYEILYGLNIQDMPFYVLKLKGKD